jgi:hypothetical protein
MTDKFDGVDAAVSALATDARFRGHARHRAALAHLLADLGGGR